MKMKIGVVNKRFIITGNGVTQKNPSGSPAGRIFYNWPELFIKKYFHHREHREHGGKGNKIIWYNDEVRGSQGFL